jgi:nitrite reductase/ring-hydroxylating ferredoxin subunit
MIAVKPDTYILAASLAEVRSANTHVVHLDGNSIALFAVDEQVFAVDNRCPHMGYPLSRGTVNDCILTCHWHHARFDLATGGTFDQWADDVRSFPVEVRGNEVWVDLAPRMDPVMHQRNRLSVGLERNLSLVIGKAVITLLDAGVTASDPFGIGLEFGVKYRQGGWGQGLTIHTCMMNLIPWLDVEDRPRALYHGLSAVARDSNGMAPRFMVRPLPSSGAGIETLKRWFRRFIEVRDSEGAERCIVSAVQEGADQRQLADMLFAAATDHRYLQIGHVLDFTNKAFEALDVAGWEHAEPVLSSLSTAYANADRMEESNAWRNPIDLVAILERAFESLPVQMSWDGGGKDITGLRDKLVPVLFGEEPQAIADTLLSLINQGRSPQDIAEVVAYAAALRIARFHTNNEFSDWDRALHTFTFANAVHQGLLRSRSVDLVRGVFDAAMSIYLDRFLNIPPARLPEPHGAAVDASKLPDEFAVLLDKQQMVKEAGALVTDALSAGVEDRGLLAVLGKMLLREDRDFHTIQTVEAAFRQYQYLRGTPEGAHVLVAAARYLAAHSPTVRAQGQTYQIASRLHGGQSLFEE